VLETRLVDSSLVNFLLAVIVYKVFRRVPELSFSLSIIVFNLISFGCSGQSVLSSPLEREWIKYAFYSDTLHLLDPFAQPFSAREEIVLLKGIDERTDLNLGEVIARREQFLAEDKLNINGWYSSDLAELWNVNAEISYRTSGLNLHYTLGSKYTNNQDTTFGLTYNKFLLPIRSRSRQAYMSYELTDITKVGFGRIPFNWSLIGNSGLIISENTWPKDGYFMSHKSSNLSFDFFTVRLDDVLSNDLRYPTSATILAKRYLSAHRILFVLNKQLKISLSEAVIFGGSDRALMLQYINPVNVYFISKQSDRWGFEEEKANPVIGLDVLYTSNSGKSRVYLQMVIDDIDFVPELTHVFPNRYAVQCQLSHRTNNSGSLVFSIKEVSDWMYTSFYSWGNFTNYHQFVGNSMNGVTEVNFEHQIDINSYLISARCSFLSFKDQNSMEQFDFASSTERMNKRAKFCIAAQRATSHKLMLKSRLDVINDFTLSEMQISMSLGVGVVW